MYLLSKRLGGLHDLDGHQFVALGLEAADHLTDQSPLHAVGLDGNEGSLATSSLIITQLVQK